ncbi:putative ankyrin repeat domain family protein [Carex littledalei]|uniref:Putative ankyrin repeat domain family protein n=1 Tax=Carex littledalei TaxID=544730 RepID=A0A833RHY1_9POAL|nr:putative ankyrin repeat domain family protein [Carex littledalei]
MRTSKPSENIVQVILEWNSSLAAETDKSQNTLLHYAALIGNSYAVKELLLKDTGSVYKDNLSGSFPVHLAAEAGNYTVIKELLSMCPDVGELLDKEKRNFLHVAVEKKRIGVITLICQVGINAKVRNAKDKDGNTPLHLAVISSDSDIILIFCFETRE